MLSLIQTSPPAALLGHGYHPFRTVSVYRRNILRHGYEGTDHCS